MECLNDYLRGSTKATFDCTHDRQDALSGDVYAGTLQRCMAATQQIEGGAQVYHRWLAGDTIDKTNLLLRALVLRQDELINAMETVSLDPVRCRGRN